MNLTIDELEYLINILEERDDEVGTDIFSKCVVEYSRIKIKGDSNE